MYQISRLKSGLTIATAEMPHMASVSLGLWVGVGGRYAAGPLACASGLCAERHRGRYPPRQDHRFAAVPFAALT